MGTMVSETLDSLDIKGLLPPNYIWQGSMLTYCRGQKVEPLCNFVPIITGKANTASSYQVEFYMGDDIDSIVAQIAVPLKAQKLYEVNPRLTIHPDSRTINRHLDYILGYVLNHYKVPTQYEIDALGITQIGEEEVYVAGDTFLSKAGAVIVENCIFKKDVSRYTLDINPHYSEAELIEKMLIIADILPSVTFPLVASFLLGISLDIFREAGVIADFWLCLVGESEMFKTTLAEFCTCLYNRSTGFSSCSDGFTSTYAALDSFLHMFNDTTVVLDDLCKSDNRRMMDEQTDIICRLQRSHTNNTPRKKLYGKSTVGTACRSFVVATAERHLTSYSAASRMLAIEVNRKCDLNKLHKAQQEPLVLSSFAAKYIPYLLGNRASIIAKVRMETYEPLDEKQSTISIRIANHCKALKISLGIFLDYAQEVEGIDASTAMQTKKFIDDLFHKIAIQNVQRLEKTKGRKNYDYGNALAYNLECLRFGNTKEDLVNCAGVVIRGEYFLLPVSVVNLMRECFRDNTIEIKSINKHLARQGLLHLDQSGNTTKKRFKIRMLHLNMQELDKLRTTPFKNDAEMHENGFCL